MGIKNKQQFCVIFSQICIFVMKRDFGADMYLFLHMELYLYLFADWIFRKSVFVCELDLSQISLFAGTTDPAVFVA